MGQKRQPDRAASEGKFCIWIETLKGEAFCVPTEFDDVKAANNAAAAMVSSPEVGNVFDRIIVYNDEGWFQYELER